MVVRVITLSIRVIGFPRRASVASEKNLFGVYRDFGQFTGENWSSVQGYDLNRLAGMRDIYSTS